MNSLRVEISKEKASNQQRTSEGGKEKGYENDMRGTQHSQLKHISAPSDGCMSRKVLKLKLNDWQ